MNDADRGTTPTDERRIPECLTHADAYRGPASVFRREGEVWREYPLEGGAPRFEFKQVHRAKDVVDLLNLTPRPEIADWRSLIVRLPVCGGVAQIASGVPQRWSDLFQVWRD